MTAVIGTFSLGLALAVSLYGAVASFVGARRRNPVLVESARIVDECLDSVLRQASAQTVAVGGANDVEVADVTKARRLGL